MGDPKQKSGGTNMFDLNTTYNVPTQPDEEDLEQDQMLRTQDIIQMPPGEQDFMELSSMKMTVSEYKPIKKHKKTVP